MTKDERVKLYQMLYSVRDKVRTPDEVMRWVKEIDDLQLAQLAALREQNKGLAESLRLYVEGGKG